MHAHRFELLADGVGDGGFAAVGQHDWGAVRGMQREQLQPGLDIRHLRKQRVHVLGADRLDVGDLAVSELRQRFGDMSICFVSIRLKSERMTVNSLLA